MSSSKIPLTIGLGAVAILALGSMGSSKKGSKYYAPSGDWGSRKKSLRAMSRSTYSPEEIERIVYFQPLIDEKATKYNVSPTLVSGLAHTLSQYQSEYESPFGGLGLFQMTQGMWSSLSQKNGVSADPLDPNSQVEFAYFLLDDLQKRNKQSPHAYDATVAMFVSGYEPIRDLISKYGESWIDYMPEETKKIVEAVNLSQLDFEDVYAGAI